MARLSKEVLTRSRIAERAQIDNDNGAGRETSLVRIQVDEADSRAWRITLPRADRKDGRPPLLRGVGAPNNSSPVFNAQQFGYSAGEQNTPTLPPRRDAPVAGDGTDVDPLFVEIAWGTSVGGVARLLAHWPMQGASLVVTGSYVEVFAGTFMIGVPDAQLPVLQAAIAPDDGLAVADSAELSIQQSVNVTVGEAAGDAAVLYVPDFARRVQVVLTDPTTGHVESTGHPRCWFDWFDDSGVLCASWMQGSVIGVSPQYVPVPARAVLLRIGTPGPSLACGEDLFTSQVALVDWRIAP